MNCLLSSSWFSFLLIRIQLRLLLQFRHQNIFHPGSTSLVITLIKPKSIKLKQDLRRNPIDVPQRRTMDNDDESENNMFPKLQSITFDPSREITDRTRSTRPSRERADMRFYKPSIVFLDTGSSDHPQEVVNFMMKFKLTILGIAVCSEYVKVNMKSVEKSWSHLFIDISLQSRIEDADKSPNSPIDFNFGQLSNSHMEIQRLW